MSSFLKNIFGLHKTSEFKEELLDNKPNKLPLYLMRLTKEVLNLQSFYLLCTGKSVSEALILESVKPTLWQQIVHWITSSEHVVYKNYFKCQNKTQFLYTTCSELAIFLYWTRNSMNNLSSYCGLTDSRMSASEKDLPVLTSNRLTNKLCPLNGSFTWHDCNMDCQVSK